MQACTPLLHNFDLGSASESADPIKPPNQLSEVWEVTPSDHDGPFLHTQKRGRISLDDPIPETLTYLSLEHNVDQTFDVLVPVSMEEHSVAEFRSNGVAVVGDMPVPANVSIFVPQINEETVEVVQMLVVGFPVPLTLEETVEVFAETLEERIAHA